MFRKIVILAQFWAICFAEDSYVINNKKFPDDFLFGVATAAYQIEGGWNADGKGENIWDHITHTNPSFVKDKTNGDIACDSYNKYEIDVDMLKHLGVKHYRFSLSWSRILPTGSTDNINEAGVKYYQTLIDLLKSNNIEPLITLYHWDLPQTIQDNGGFLNQSIINLFANYAKLCFQLFGNDVKYWATFNEATYVCYGGYGDGFYAPGIQGSGYDDYLCGHNLIKSHAKAWHVYDEEFRKKQGGLITIVNNINYFGASSESVEDLDASERKMEFELGWWANPIYNGDYPELMKQRIILRSEMQGLNISRLPEFSDDEKLFIKGTSDFFGVNTYHTFLVKDVDEPDFDIISRASDMKVEVLNSIADDPTWGINPLIKWIQNKYNNPDIMITENGYGVNEENDKFDDDFRITLVQHYLSRIRDLIDEGANIFGYTLWSLMDNMEWSSGYTVKFGIYHVDFNDENRTRTPKKSSDFYKKVCSSYCLVENCVA